MKANLRTAVAAMTTVVALGLGATAAGAGGATFVHSSGSWVLSGAAAPNHQLPCASGFAGSHYRNDPASPASPENEVWLDFTTDDGGTATAVAQVPWVVGHSLIAPSERASSVVVHDHATNPAGVAGPKLACIDVPFSS